MYLELLLLLFVTSIVIGCIVYIFNSPKKDILKDSQPIIEPEPSQVQEVPVEEPTVPVEEPTVPVKKSTRGRKPQAKKPRNNASV